jgi:uncharacterized protein (TIGR02646 family)
MKKIVKQAQSTELQQWRANNAGVPENLKYGCGGFPNDAVLKALLKEQGFLCAYTLIKISTNKAHIEHLKPQKKCNDGEDVAWNNMVACFPQPGAKHPGFGAVQKDSWWEETEFISPLSENCEARFKYKNDGSIEAVSAMDSAAKTTISKLKLDCDRLKEARKIAIMKAGLHKRADDKVRLKTESKVRSFSNSLAQKQSNAFVEFCTVLEHAAEDYIRSLQKRAQRRRYSRSGGR